MFIIGVSTCLCTVGRSSKCPLASGQPVLVPGHGHIRGRQETVVLQAIATENISIQPKVNNRPRLYIAFKKYLE